MLKRRPGGYVGTYDTDWIFKGIVHITKCPETPPPPNRIPGELVEQFTMHGKVPVRYLYYCDLDQQAPHNTVQKYDEVLASLSNGTFVYYGGEEKEFFQAFADYPVAEKSVLIWGLAGCNCEAMAIWQKASQVYVVDYNKPVCDHHKVTTLTHDELKQSGIKADYAISFSSFEHDGLGRYGDTISPDGIYAPCGRQSNF